MMIGIHVDQEKPDELHYYCSGRTFHSLLQHAKLWLTDLSLSNDSKEGRWALGQYLELFKRTPRDQVRMRGAKLAIKTAIEDRDALGMCFSTHGDLLSQWRGYADNGAGFCVTFDRKALGQLVSENPITKSTGSFGLHRVSYDRIELLNIPAELYAAFSKRIEEYDEGELRDGGLSWAETKASALTDSEVISKLFQVKNPAFQEEQEWRLLLVDKAGRIPGVDYRESGGVISPKLEIDFDLSAIKRVRLGPRNPNAPQKIDRVLKHYGCDASSNPSSASYVVR